MGVIALLFGVFDVQPTNLEAPLLVLTTTHEDGTSKDRVLARLEIPVGLVSNLRPGHAPLADTRGRSRAPGPRGALE